MSTRAEHPSHYLRHNGTIDADQSARLRADADEIRDNQTTTVLTLKATTVRDDRDIRLTLPHGTGTYQAERRPGCICQDWRTPLHCQCRTRQCASCHAEFTSVEFICLTGYCIQDVCPLCSHRREVCETHTVEKDIHDEAARMREESSRTMSIAECYIDALAQSLGDGTEAPAFPVARRTLNSSPLLADSGEKEREKWTMKDGSEISRSEDKLWLRIRE